MSMRVIGLLSARYTSSWALGLRAVVWSLLGERGVQLVGPNAGDLACRATGPGRMAEPNEIVEAAAAQLARPPAKVVILSDSPYDRVDPVRYATVTEAEHDRNGLRVRIRLGSYPVVDDEPRLINLVRSYLEEESYQVVTAANAQRFEWPVAIPFSIPAEGRYRVELVVSKVNVKWRVKGITRE